MPNYLIRQLIQHHVKCFHAVEAGIFLNQVTNLKMPCCGIFQNFSLVSVANKVMES